MAYVDEYLVEEKQSKKDCYRIIFTVFTIFDHQKIVKTFLNPTFAKSVSGTVTLKSYVVTTGGYDTLDGFQHSIFSGPEDRKRSEHLGAEYLNLKLNSDEFISRLEFVLSTRSRNYVMTFVANCLEIRPRPPEQVVKTCIRKLKKALAKAPQVFLASARTKFVSGILDFLGERYRAVPHNIYYATHDLIKCLSVWSGMDPKVEHDKDAQDRLTAILNQIVSGTHRQFFKSSIWKRNREVLKSLDVHRYANLVVDLYEMRKKADYDMDFEMGEFLPELSNLMIKVEELFDLTLYVREGSIATTKGKLLKVFQRERELEPLGESDPFDNLGSYMIKYAKGHYYKIWQRGLILAEGYDLKKFLTRLIKRKDILYSPFRPPLSRRNDYVKVEKIGTSWVFSGTFSREIAKEEGYIPYTIENIRKLSDLTKADELVSIQNDPAMRSRSDSFCYHGCFFEIHVFSDGRFYLFSPLIGQDVCLHMTAMLKLRAIMAKIVDSLWKYQSSISFSAIAIAS